MRQFVFAPGDVSLALREDLVAISMDAVEAYDGPLPSITMSLVCEMKHSSGEFRYTAKDIGFELHDLAAFRSQVNDIVMLVGEDASVQCMSQSFVWRCSRESGGLFTSISASEVEHDYIDASTRMRVAITSGLLADLATQLEELLQKLSRLRLSTI